MLRGTDIRISFSMNMDETERKTTIWKPKYSSSFTLFVLVLTFGVGKSQATYQSDDSIGYDNNFAAPSRQLAHPDDGYLDKFFDVEVSKKDGVSGKEYFPLLMPKVHPTQEESYLCTPIEIKDEEYYITGIWSYI